MGNKIIYYCDKCNEILNTLEDIKMIAVGNKVLEVCEKCYKEEVYKKLPKEVKLKQNPNRKKSSYIPKGTYRTSIIAKDLEDEVWKPIKDFEGYYEVSNKGRIKSSKRNIILNQGNITKGYLGVSLAKDGVSYSKRVHKLVADAFIPNIENKPYINHINGNKKDNRVENLEWCTPKENSEHAKENKLVSKGKKKVYCLEDNKIYDSIKQLAKDFNANEGQVKNACDNANNTLKNKHITYL